MASFNDTLEVDEDDSFVVARKSGKKCVLSDTSSSSEDEESEIINSSQELSEIEDSFVVTSNQSYRDRPKSPLLTSDEGEEESHSEEDSDIQLASRTFSGRTNVGNSIQDVTNVLTPSDNEDSDVVEESKDSDVVEESEDEASAINNKSVDVIHNISNGYSEEELLEISSDDEPKNFQPVLKQSNLTSFISREAKPPTPHKTNAAVSPQATQVVQSPRKAEDGRLMVSLSQYKLQENNVRVSEFQLMQAKNALRVVNLEKLPDKGKLLLQKAEMLESKLKQQRELLVKMAVIKDDPSAESGASAQVAWDQIEAGFGAVAPRTFGKKGLERFNAEKQMTVETLDHLHKSLENCPTENDVAADPQGLKVDLMLHQKRALAWLVWREQQRPSGGILADDMGLGKTLTMIALTMTVLEAEKDEEDDRKEKHRNKYPGGTLVVCPASLLNQWSGEVQRRTKRGLLSVEHYHGAKRETKAKRLAQHDLVISTYTIILNEFQKQGAVFQVRWRRIILDEAHQIRNHKAQSSEAVCKLSGKSRWALTGTPVHNKELDMYALLKFLRCTPFDDLQVWRHWVTDKSTGGQERLHAVISSLMLRRTKVELMEKGMLQNLPERKWELIPVGLDKDELEVYQRILIFSRTLFAQFLHQRAEKNQDATDLKLFNSDCAQNEEYFKMRNKLLKLNKVKNIKQHEILVLLLRLRQICCHPSLITAMLEGNEDLGNAESQEESEEMDLLEQLNNLTIMDEAEGNVAQGASEEAVGLKEASKGFLNPSQPIFSENRRSSKIRALIEVLKKTLASGDKAIVVSQWTSLLRLVSIQLKEEGVKFDTLDGSIPVQKRMPIVDSFNDPRDKTRVLLLSLTAGGVGLNLVGGNHLFLLDLHWNPQLENQAQDRIYRMGQTKPVFVYKFMASDTIEERIKNLQDRKLELANSMLTGSKQVISSKLSLQDLKMLFDFK